MRLFRFAPIPQRSPPPDALIRIFQSEVGEVREDPEPAQLRVTLHVLAGLLAALLAVSFFMQINRVVTSSAGQIVTTEPSIVLQALDASIIKSLPTRPSPKPTISRITSSAIMEPSTPVSAPMHKHRSHSKMW